MLTSLLACQPHPTLILQLEDMQEELTRFTYKLYAMLGQAGAQGLQMPNRAAMKKQFGSYLKEARQPAARDATSSQDTLSRSQVSSLLPESNMPACVLSCTGYKADGCCVCRQRCSRPFSW